MVLQTIGKEKCPIIDTWWQTETGGMLISALPGIETIPLKPGSGTRSIPGVNIDVVDEMEMLYLQTQKDTL